MSNGNGNLRPPWPKGVSGNPKGLPTKPHKFRKMCRALTPEALAALKAALQEPGERVPAAKAVLEFAWGKAPSAEVIAQLDGQAKASRGAAVREDALEAVSDALAEGSPESH